MGRWIAVTFIMFFLLPALMTRAGTDSDKSYQDFDEETFMGMVYDYNNRPCSDALIIIDSVEGPKTDMNGRFFLQSVSRGTHEITIKKQDFEDLTITFDFYSRSQVLHANLISFEQLLEMADEAISHNRLYEAEQFLERALTIRSHDPVAQYLKAVVCKEKGDIADAVEVLESILAEGYQGPYVYLTIGNLCEYYQNDCEKAIHHLEKYLQYERDDKVERRIADLKTNLGAE
jgi:tetratricopeptide (TPR) repeat protein